MTVTPIRPLDQLADSLKVYRVTGCADRLVLTLDQDSAEALETLLRLHARFDAVSAEREARIMAEARRVETLRAEAVRMLDRLRAEAILVGFGTAFLCLACVAAAIALAGSLIP